MKKRDSQLQNDDKMAVSTEKLTRQLNERLDLLLDQPAEEVNTEEIEKILNLLDQLAPQEQENTDTLSPEDAFAQFEKEYENRAEKLSLSARNGTLPDFTSNAKPEKKNSVRVLRYAGIAAAVIVLTVTILNAGAYAAAGKGFFELITNRGNTMGNLYMGTDESGLDMHSQEKTVYRSWEEVPQELKDKILLPSYLPDGVESESIAVWNDPGEYVEIKYYDGNRMEEVFKVSIRLFDQMVMKNEFTIPNGDFLVTERIGDRDYYLYRTENDSTIYFYIDNNLYCISGQTTEELKKIAVSFP